MNIAIVILAGTESHEGLGRIVNGLEAASEMILAGDNVRIVFDGAGTQGLAAISAPTHRRYGLYRAVREHISGACSFCANAFHVRDQLVSADVPLLSEYNDHPSLRQLLVDGYQVLTF